MSFCLPLGTPNLHFSRKSKAPISHFSLLIGGNGTLPRLRTLNLSATHIEGPGLHELSGLSELRELDLSSNTAIGDHDLAPLADLTNLRRLNLRYARLRGDGLAYLSELPTLRVLKLMATDVGDEGGEHLAGLTSLRRLELAETRVGDDGVRHLEGLSNLNKLNLSDTQITDRAVPVLSTLKNLEELALYYTDVTEEGERRLREALPNCYVH